MKVEYFFVGRWIFITILILTALIGIWIPWDLNNTFSNQLLGTYLIIWFCILIAFLAKELQ